MDDISKQLVDLKNGFDAKVKPYLNVKSERTLQSSATMKVSYIQALLKDYDKSRSWLTREDPAIKTLKSTYADSKNRS